MVIIVIVIVLNMSLKTLNFNKDLCRCCHAEGSFDDLAQPYTHEGREEVYSDMIKDSFNIEVSPVPGPLCVVTYKICKKCIERVQDAFVFKKQVQKCELLFMDIYKRSFSEKGLGLSTTVKEEISDLSDPGDDYSLMNDFNNEDLIMKSEDSEDDATLNEIKISKARSKPTAKSKPKKPKEIKRKKIKEEAEKDPDGQTKETKKKKGGWKKFVLRPEDYRKVDNDYHCGHCENRYAKFLTLRYHIKTKHYNTPKFACEMCTETFMTQARFTVHKLEIHGIDDRFKCNACNSAFNTRVQLRKHINNYHMMGEKHKCEHCKYESFSYEGLYKHKFKHLTVRDHHCRFCRKSFLRKANLDLHERIHTGDRRKVCKTCGQAFVQKASLNYHMAKYHPEVNF